MTQPYTRDFLNVPCFSLNNSCYVKYMIQCFPDSCLSPYLHSWSFLLDFPMIYYLSSMVFSGCIVLHSVSVPCFSFLLVGNSVVSNFLIFYLVFQRIPLRYMCFNANSFPQEKFLQVEFGGTKVYMHTFKVEPNITL